MLKYFTRLAMNAAQFIFMLPFFVAVVCAYLIVLPIYLFFGLWNWLELWAFYGGDKAKRDRDRWLNS